MQSHGALMQMMVGTQLKAPRTSAVVIACVASAWKAGSGRKLASVSSTFVYLPTTYVPIYLATYRAFTDRKMELSTDRQTDRRMDGMDGLDGLEGMDRMEGTDGWMDGCMDGWTDGRIEGRRCNISCLTRTLSLGQGYCLWLLE